MIKAAIFDIDNTILKGKSSERIFIRYLREKGIITYMDILRFIFTFLVKLFSFRGLYIKNNKSYLKGKDNSVIEEAARDCFRDRVISFISREALAEIQKKRESGHVIVLLSGTLDVLIEQFKEYCGADVALGSNLERCNGRLTGELQGIHPYGCGKALVLQDLASKMQIDLSNSYGYADQYADVKFLCLLGHPVAVNADLGLKIYARIKGWSTMDF